MAPEIIFEDENLLILGKPSGWIVNEAVTTKDQSVLQTWLKENYKYPISDSKEYRSGIVHRLDKETSGIIIVAKDKQSFWKLQAQFKARTVKKEYFALAHGKVEPKEGSIDAPVGRLPWNRERFGVLPGGRDAKTGYKVLGHYTLNTSHYTLLELAPKTGRTHQIRIHLKHIGHPIVSDTFYAGRKTARVDRGWCPRLFLHAKGISFTHPKTAANVGYQATLPTDLESALDTLESSTSRG